MFIYAPKFFRVLLISFIVIVFFNSFNNNHVPLDSSTIQFYNGQRVEFLGRLTKQPDQRVNHIKLTVEALLVNQSPVSGKVLVSTSFYPVYQYGDELLFTCNLKLPEKFDDFSYDRYLAKSDIYSICSYPKIKLLSRGNGDFLLAKIFEIQNKLKSLINSNLPEPQAGMLVAMILGDRRGIPAELTEKFNITGTTHLLAISGLHITILFSILMQLMSAAYFSRRTAFYLATVFLIFYLALIGFPPSAVRAGIMSFILMLSMYLGRLNKSTNSILLAASLMIFINPKILRDDISFQLSFAASLGIIYFLPTFQNGFKKISNLFGLRDVLQISLAAYLATLPLVILHFSRFSLIGIMANLLVVPVVSCLLILGFLAILLSLLIPNVSLYFFWPSFFVLTYMIKIIDLFHLIPYAALEI